MQPENIERIILASAGHCACAAHDTCARNGSMQRRGVYLFQYIFTKLTSSKTEM